MNPKAGCAGSILNLLQMEEFNHQVELEIGVLGVECSQMMKHFFQELREKKRQEHWHSHEKDSIISNRAAGVLAVPCTYNPL